jgi:antitoxin (DNA-binding transcriptional repressor) of toxin-antitoxin stability system
MEDNKRGPVPATRAAKNFGELLDRVLSGERVLISWGRSGRVVAEMRRVEPPAGGERPEAAA